jgi:tRNA A37 threonylcarbamoyladenosine biosynthesis protein TsaE
VILSPQQDAALLSVHKWYRARARQVFRLFGFAGTGKTSLARRLAEGIDGTVMFAAFTGKAAYVMRCKGCDGATTIHNLIYRLKSKNEKGELEFELDRDSRARRASMIIIDECSMVNEAIARDLLAFGVPVLALGDPAQLPTIDGYSFFISGKPDIMLTDIHR